MHERAQCLVGTMPATAGCRRRRNAARNVLRDQRGISTAEYAVLFVIIAIGALATWKNLASRVSKQVTDGTTTLNAVLQAHIDGANKDKSDQGPHGPALLGTSHKTDDSHTASPFVQNKDDGRGQVASGALGTVPHELPAGSTGVGKQPGRGDSQTAMQQTNVTAGSVKDFQDREAARLYNAGVDKDGQHVAKEDQTKQDATVGPRKMGSRRGEPDKEDQRRTSADDSANKPRSAGVVKYDDPPSSTNKGGQRHQ